ncbi:MAG: helix-turn-helix transcriptional regulator [Candidatus Gastranaerophilales bacterium]
MNTKVLVNLGKNLKKIRLENGLTQEVLAEKVGVHPTYVGKIEIGKCNPSVKILFKFSRALNTNLNHIFDFDK